MVYQIEINSHIGVAPLDFALIKDFSKLKPSNKDWFSKPFYSHSQGYRLRLSVSPNAASGDSEGKQTHISKFQCTST